MVRHSKKIYVSRPRPLPFWAPHEIIFYFVLMDKMREKTKNSHNLPENTTCELVLRAL